MDILRLGRVQLSTLLQFMWKMSRLWGIAMMSWAVIYKRYFQWFWQFLPITRLSITPTTPVDESADEDVSLLCAPQPPDELLLEVLSCRTNEDGNDDDEDDEGGNVDEPVDIIIIDIVDLIIIDIVDIIIVDFVDMIIIDIVDIVDMIIIDIVDIIIVDIVDLIIIDIVDIM